IGTPSSAGAYAPGQEKAPAALRAAGLVSLLGDVEDRGDSELWRWRPDPSEPYAQNLDAVVAAARSTADRVRIAAAEGRRVLVLGGDCTVGVGTLAGLPAGTGLLYFDMHPDLNVPSSVPDGALDWMGLAHMLGQPGTRPQLSTVGGDAPLLLPHEVLLFGYRPDQLTPHERDTIARLSLDGIDQAEVAIDPESAARDALARMDGRCERIAIHFDVDVIDFTDAPLSEHTGRNIGLPFEAAMRALEVLLESDRVAALTITELSPAHGAEDGSTLRRFVERLAQALAPQARASL
ncbi:MAG TPA: arginase family protein, partial [Candidatus Dormibacteraeota bacterium]|nr:arginase family protein [Candidatus Dormibacteraeota bacterium]